MNTPIMAMDPPLAPDNLPGTLLSFIRVNPKQPCMHPSRPWANDSIIILPVPRPPLITSDPIFPYRNLDPLRSETFAQIRAFNHARKFLRRIDVKFVAEAGREDGSGGGVEGLSDGGRADVDKIHFQSVGEGELGCGPKEAAESEKGKDTGKHPRCAHSGLAG